MKHRLFARRAQRGFTLLETLLALGILTLLSLLLLGGGRAALHTYEQSTFLSECATVSDTLETALGDVLRYATDVRCGENQAVSAYSNENYGITDGCLSVGTADVDRGILYLAPDVCLLGSYSYSDLCLVPADYNPATGGNGTGKFDLTYRDGVFSGSYRLYDPANGLLSGEYTFAFRTIND